MFVRSSCKNTLVDISITITVLTPYTPGLELTAAASFTQDVTLVRCFNANMTLRYIRYAEAVEIWCIIYAQLNLN